MAKPAPLVIELRLDTSGMAILRDIQTKLGQIIEQGEQIMATVADLQADVAAEGTVIASAVTLLQGLKAALDAAGTDPAALAALSADIEAQTQALADAVVANTPATP